MGNNELLQKMSQAIIDLNKDVVVSTVEEGLAAGLSPLEMIEGGLQVGINTVGDRFESFECFLPELIGSAEAFNAAMEILEPIIAKMSGDKETSGIVIMGTVKGDIHKIGKDIVTLLLKTRGFEVIDLGEDVPASKFLEAADKNSADIIALSALLNTTMPAQQDMIKLLTEQEVRSRYSIMVGGAPVTQDWAEEIGADGYAKTAEEAVRLAQDLMAKRASA